MKRAAGKTRLCRVIIGGFPGFSPDKFVRSDYRFIWRFLRRNPFDGPSARLSGSLSVFLRNATFLFYARSSDVKRLMFRFRWFYFFLWENYGLERKIRHASPLIFYLRTILYFNFSFVYIFTFIIVSQIS